MADDWKPGDRALCIDDSPPKDCGGYREANPEYIANLKKGAVYTITHVVIGRFDPSYVGIGDKNRRAGGWSARFIKLEEHTPDEQDAETIRLLNGAPVKEQADA